MNFTLSLPRDYYFISSFDGFLMRRCLCLQNILKLDETHFKGRDKIFYVWILSRTDKFFVYFKF